MQEMKDLSLVIVGGGSGLDALLARMAADAGASKIGIIDINRDAADAALKPARAKGLPTAAASCDIQVGPQSHAAFEEVVAKIGRIDSLVNSAAIYPRRPILEITDAEWDASNGINIKGTYHMMVAAIRHMQQQEPKAQVRGRIVNGRGRPNALNGTSRRQRRHSGELRRASWHGD
jgi:3-oxoacyl-[acyl-carrier protein] reductase